MEASVENEVVFAAEDSPSTMETFISTTPIWSKAECSKLVEAVKKVDSSLSKSMLNVTGFPLAPFGLLAEFASRVTSLVQPMLDQKVTRPLRCSSPYIIAYNYPDEKIADVFGHPPHRDASVVTVNLCLTPGHEKGSGELLFHLPSRLVSLPQRCGTAVIHSGHIVHSTRPSVGKSHSGKRYLGERMNLVMWFTYDDRFEAWPALPEHIQAHVFSYLRPFELGQVSQTCRLVAELALPLLPRHRVQVPAGRRALILQEMVSTEASYLQMLTDSLTFLESQPEPPAVLPYVRQLVAVHQPFYVTLRERVLNGSTVADLFAALTHFSDVYADYCLFVGRNMDELAQYNRPDPTTGLSPYVSLIAPVRRLPRYQLLVGDLMRGESGAEAVDLTDALQRLSTLCDEINQRRQQSELELELFKAAAAAAAPAPQSRRHRFNPFHRN